MVQGRKKGWCIDLQDTRVSGILLLRAFIPLGLVCLHCPAQLPPAQAKLLKRSKSDAKVCQIRIPVMQIKSKQKITGNLEAQTEKERLPSQKGRLALTRKCQKSC